MFKPDPSHATLMAIGRRKLARYRKAADDASCELTAEDIWDHMTWFATTLPECPYPDNRGGCGCDFDCRGGR